MQSDDWHQAVLEFTDHESATDVALRDLHPHLTAAQADGTIAGWWFIRKSPCWRLRYRPAPDHNGAGRLRDLFTDLSDTGRIVGWTESLYEPETHAFGGTEAMDLAHELFQHDSHAILDHLHRSQNTEPGSPDLGPRELAILLPTVLLRSAGQDIFEQGDVWAKVADLRQPHHHATTQSEDLAASVRRLITVDVGPTSPLVDGGPLAYLTDWAAAFERAGQHLADLARRGRLERGVRAVLAHHVIFHWNRWGLPRVDQEILSTLTKESIMGTNDHAVSQPAARLHDANLAAVDTMMTDTPDTTAEHLRHRLADTLRKHGTVTSDRVDAAIRTVPRHRFVPAVPLDEAYADQPVYTKHDGAGASISAASQPTVVAMMLDQLQVEPGQRILELGAGTGYNAGLLATLAGEHGHVTTIDVDDDIVDGARRGLAAAGIDNVTVLLSDGALGHADGAPYDRIIATVGAYGIPDAWLDQLAPDGRLVVPLRLRGSVSRSIAFERAGDGALRSIDSKMCTFMPLRGIADDARRILTLTPNGSVTLHTNQDQHIDPATLANVLSKPSSETWTGVTFRGPESQEYMDLWLACTMDNALSRMPAEPSAFDTGLLRKPFRALAAVDGTDLAYLAVRPGDVAADGGQLYEVGVIGHGPDSAQDLAERVAEQIRIWNTDYRSRSVVFALHPADAPATAPVPGEFAFTRAPHRLVITWQ